MQLSAPGHGLSWSTSHLTHTHTQTHTYIYPPLPLIHHWINNKVEWVMFRGTFFAVRIEIVGVWTTADRSCVVNVCVCVCMCVCVCACIRFLSHETLIITAVPDVTKHMKHTSWIMESYFYISPCFGPSSHPPRLHSPFCPRLLLMLNLSAAAIRDGPFSFMLHRPIWLEWVHGRERGISAAEHRIISNDAVCIRSTTPPDRPVRLPPPHPSTSSPPPSVYCSKSHRANWDRAAKWSRRDVVSLQRKQDPVSSLPSVCISASTSGPLLTTPQLCAVASRPLGIKAHVLRDSSARAGAVGAWLKDEVSSQNWLERRRAVWIRQWSVAF